MTKLIVKEAITKKEMKQFVHFPNALYAGNKYYVPQIESAYNSKLYWGASLTDRVSDFESVGCGFESHAPHQIIRP